MNKLKRRFLSAYKLKQRRQVRQMPKFAHHTRRHEHDTPFTTFTVEEFVDKLKKNLLQNLMASESYTRNI